MFDTGPVLLLFNFVDFFLVVKTSQFGIYHDIWNTILGTAPNSFYATEPYIRHFMKTA